MFRLTIMLPPTDLINIKRNRYADFIKRISLILVDLVRNADFCTLVKRSKSKKTKNKTKINKMKSYRLRII